jgi:hypothetical protein
VNLSKGTRLGPYEIVAPIEAGGMGEVYRARVRFLTIREKSEMRFDHLNVIRGWWQAEGAEHR